MIFVERWSLVATSIADHSSENRWIYGDSVGFSNVSNFEISKFYWLFFERSIFVGHGEFHFLLIFLFVLFTSSIKYLFIIIPLIFINALMHFDFFHLTFRYFQINKIESHL